MFFRIWKAVLYADNVFANLNKHEGHHRRVESIKVFDRLKPPPWHHIKPPFQETEQYSQPAKLKQSNILYTNCFSPVSHVQIHC